jgi:hypothetical protein
MGEILISKGAIITVIVIAVIIVLIIVIICFVAAKSNPPSPTRERVPPIRDDVPEPSPVPSPVDADSSPTPQIPLFPRTRQTTSDASPTPQIPLFPVVSPQVSDVTYQIPIIVPPPPINYGRSRGETICCQALEQHYGVPFRTIRPPFLRNPATGHNLELDCYNEGKKIAAEYNGIQHYVYPNRFHKTEEEFRAQVARDVLKHDLCDAAGVYLITVPYNVKERDIPSFINKKLPENADMSDASPVGDPDAYTPHQVRIWAK